MVPWSRFTGSVLAWNVHHQFKNVSAHRSISPRQYDINAGALLRSHIWLKTVKNVGNGLKCAPPAPPWRLITYPGPQAGHWNLTRPGYSNPVPVTPTSRLPGYWPGSWIQEPGPWIQDSGSWILNPGSWILDPGSRIQDPGSWIQDPGSRILDPGSWIQDPGSRILDPGSRIQDSGSRILDPVGRSAVGRSAVCRRTVGRVGGRLADGRWSVGGRSAVGRRTVGGNMMACL